MMLDEQIEGLVKASEALVLGVRGVDQKVNRLASATEKLVEVTTELALQQTVTGDNINRLGDKIDRLADKIDRQSDELAKLTAAFVADRKNGRE